MTLESTNRKSFMMFTIAAATVFIVTGAILYVVKNALNATESVGDAASQLSDEIIFFQTKDEDDWPVLGVTTSLSLESLTSLCSDIRAELTIECKDALDEYFKDSVLPEVENWLGSLLHLGMPPTFKRVFENPSVNRSLTMAALARKECLLEHGAIHEELQSNCNAEAIASHALFTKYCKPSSTTFQEDWFGSWYSSEWESAPASYYDARLHWIESRRDLDLEIYEQRKETLTRNVLRSAWLETKCSAFDSKVTQPLNIWPSIQRSVLTDYEDQHGDRLSQWTEAQELEFQREVLDKEYLRLLSVAARLGDDWAIVEYHRRGTKDQAFVDSLDELRPWHSSLRRATFTGVSRVQLLTDAISAVVLAEYVGKEIDKELLIHAVCRNNPISVDCDTAFDQLESVDLSPRALEVATELRMISFEQKASSY